jgi:hypothetical protein
MDEALKRGVSYQFSDSGFHVATIGEVRLQDVPGPLWLPTDADVYIEIGRQKYRNMHHYQDY